MPNTTGFTLCQHVRHVVAVLGEATTGDLSSRDRTGPWSDNVTTVVSSSWRRAPAPSLCASAPLYLCASVLLHLPDPTSSSAPPNPALLGLLML